MAYVQPNSIIEFYSDLNLSQDYNDTLYFENPGSRDTYFNNITKLAVAERCYYARDNRGFVRVEVPMSTLIHAQYMRFKNTAYENKWWYAFVRDVNYINDNTTEVEFELDRLMSWMGNFTLHACYVERQHSETDAIGDNIVDENFNCGEYVNLNAQDESLDAFLSDSGFFNRRSHGNAWNGNNGWVYLAFVSEPIIQTSPARTGLGVYNGCSIYVFANTEAGRNQMNTQLHNADIFGQVISVVLVPEKFIPYIPSYVPPLYDGAVDYGNNTTLQRTQAPYVLEKSITKTFTYLGGRNASEGYQPANMKMYTYPYNFLVVNNSEGDEAILKYELFNSQNCLFDISASLTQNPEIVCIPKNYRGMSKNVAEAIAMKHFPMAGWASDLFMAYIAQTLSTAPIKLGTALAGGALAPSISTPISLTNRQNEKANYANELSAENSLSAGVTSSLVSGLEHSIRPQENVSAPNQDIMTILNDKEFYFLRRTVRPEYAKMIDNYFTMFGYADKTVHVPKMNARTRFTYVKTIGCKINCACPASDADFIEQLFNKGIRFWKDHTDIGNYTSPNLPLPQQNEGEQNG